MRKKLLTLTFVVTFSTIFVGSVYNNAHTDPTGSPNARTGSPGDGGNTCAISGCHTGIAVGTKTNVLSSNVPAEGYTGGTKYTITATARSSSNRNTFGFQVSPQTQAGALVGTITITNSTATQVTGGGKYVTHKQAGITGTNGVKTWSFDWTAPAAGTGDVTFYGAFNHANGNGGSTGDSIFKTTFVIKEKVVQGVSNDALTNLGFSVFPNPASEQLFLANNHSVKFDHIKVYDMNGKLVYEVKDNNFENQLKFDLSNFSKGMYLLKLSMNNEELGTTKFLVK
jgi:hypothetical protein